MATTKEKLKAWAEAAAFRAVKTAAQGAIVTIGTTAVTLGDVDWLVVGSAAALMAILSVLTSIAGVPEVEDGASVAKLKGSE